MRQYLSLLPALLLLSCSESKQYDSCSEMGASIKGKKYSDLVKEWGEPSRKEEFPAGGKWYVEWSGVGYNGRTAEIHFDNIDYSWGASDPFKADGVSCD